MSDQASAPHMEASLADIAKSQRDASILLGFVSGRQQRSMAGDGHYGTASLSDLTRILAMAPEDLRQSPSDWAALLTAVDHLAEQAQPATARSIQFTRRYVEGQGAGSSNPAIDRLITWLWRLYVGLGLVGIVTVVVTMVLLHHALDGRMILHKLTTIQTSHDDLSQLVAQAFSGDGNGPRSCDAPAATLNTVQHALCGRRHDLLRKISLTYLELEVWNITAERLFFITNAFQPSVSGILAAEAERLQKERCPPASPADGLEACAGKTTEAIVGDLTSAWNRTELRTESLLAGLANYAIPALLGFIGGTVFVFRRLFAHLDAWTLDGSERFLLILRPTLGLMLGGLASLIFESREVEAQDIKVSLGFLAFLAGYSSQYVFDVLDGFIMRDRKPGVEASIGTPTATSTTALASSDAVQKDGPRPTAK